MRGGGGSCPFRTALASPKPANSSDLKQTQAMATNGFTVKLGGFRVEASLTKKNLQEMARIKGEQEMC